MELISVIVPVYNVDKYLRRCIESLLAQTHPYLEIILVDDGSLDSCPSICDEYKNKDERIVVVHKSNGGLSSARNAGLEIAKGEYIAFLDSDDWIDKDTYKVLYENIIKYKADVSDIDSIITSEEICYQNEIEVIRILEGRDILIDYFLSDKYSCCRKLYKRDVIGDIRFPDGKINEDIATNFQFLSHAKREVKSSLKLYYYYSNPNSITGTIFRKRDFDLLDACEQLIELTQHDSELLHLAKIKQAVSYYAIIGRYISYESDTGYDPSEEINQLQIKLRATYILLLKSFISVKKKVLVTLCVLFSPHLMKHTYMMVKRFK